MGFDTGSSVFYVYPYEVAHLIQDDTACRQVTVRYPAGSEEEQSFSIMTRVLSRAGKEYFPSLHETAFETEWLVFQPLLYRTIA